ncbi:MAG: ABC-ATPase domain-containing protein [Oscillospiraceae bacterium]|jgi:predicted ABC-class ATPase|nr:ABC-ATPase domain-containing protein [Oscillospiraceae bacterium]
MKTSAELRTALRDIDHRSYPAYKSLTGNWSFGQYILNIEHVQGDPFAAPSQLSVAVDARTAGFPSRYWSTAWTRTALEDYLLRRFGFQAGRFSRQAKGSGKSGVLDVTRPGQEVLERTDCQVRGGAVTLRFEVGFPANGRTINARELERILFNFVPVCVEQGLLYANTPKGEAEQIIVLAEDQHFIRAELDRLGLAAFVADGSVLPRESGVSDRPMRDAVPFRSPEKMAVTLELPHRGHLRGMGVRRGITLIAGGGYHGKSTLLKALERGVYDHIAGDGREYVITDAASAKIRAEDGRKVTDTDISLFINHLPSGRDTTKFSTLDASGSTSQAANIAEALEAGSRVLLMDEDTSATNFMVRDELMQAVIARDQEPITPFLERARDLWQKAEVSLILVVGSCGAYFHIADQVIQMDAYHARDITAQAKAALAGRPVPALSAPGFHFPADKRIVDLSGSTQTRKNYRGDGYRQERLKVKRFGKTAFTVGDRELDLRYVEQLVDGGQTQALAYMVRYAREHLAGRSVDEVAAVLLQLIEEKGLGAVCGGNVIPAGVTLPRVQEIFACFNRY